MKRVSWVMRIAFSIVAPIVAAGTIAAAPAMAASQQPGIRPPQTCHAWRVLYGPYGAIDSYTNRSLAWTTNGAEGSSIYLARYTGSLSQCWKLLGGFGHGEIEFSLAHTGMCIRVHQGGAGAYLEDWPCLSYPSELFTGVRNNAKVMWKNVQSGLFITADIGITPFAALNQGRESNYDSSQTWFMNTSP